MPLPARARCASLQRMETTEPRGRVRYSTGAIVFHWTIALLIALNFIAVWVAGSMPEAQAMQIMGNHKAIGITVLILSIARLIWRLTHKPPPLNPDLKPWERLLATIVHHLFYVLMIGIPLAGWLLHSAFSGGQPIPVFGLFAYPGLPMAQNKALGETFAGIHGLLAWTFLAIWVLHVAGALKHQFLDKDREIWRMLPGRGA